jgi:hypothetical protein
MKKSSQIKRILFSNDFDRVDDDVWGVAKMIKNDNQVVDIVRIMTDLQSDYGRSLI